jgi:WXG100 family type VII secretion target
MSSVNLTYEQMEAAAKRLLNGQEEIESQLSSLQNEVKQLVAAGYTTESSSKQFEISYDEFNKGATQVIEGLSGMAKFLTTAATTFRDADTKLAGAIK